MSSNNEETDKTVNEVIKELEEALKLLEESQQRVKSLLTEE